MDKKKLAERLRMLKADLSGEAFSTKCGLPPSTMQGYLEGKRSIKIENLQKIAEANNVTMEWLANGALPSIQEIDDEVVSRLLLLDPEVIEIDVETSKPVVRAYDDLKNNLQMYCIHCRQWHYHGRGGKGYPYQEGRGGMAGDRDAHCITINSPFHKNGYILDVVGKLKDVQNKYTAKKALQCPKCLNYYSAAFNACPCGYKNLKPSEHPEISAIYERCVISEEKKSTTNATHDPDRYGLLGVVNARNPQDMATQDKSGYDQDFSIEEMLGDTRTVLESDTVYRQALASNIRAFKQAVINEGKMKNTDEKIDQMMKQIEALTAIVLQGQSGTHEKKRAGNDL